MTPIGDSRSASGSTHD